MNYYNSNGTEFLDQVNSLISENLDNEEFGVSEMAREMAMSRSSLHRRFKEIIGVPTSEFIRNCRLDRSKVLLKNSSATISEIAYACGFTSLAYFDICFKAYFGQSPGSYRGLMQNDVSPEPQPNKAYDNRLPKPHELEPLNGLHNFPTFVTSFIGRNEDTATILDLLREYRIITLTGTGGCGKTRLATEVVQRLDQQFIDGVWFIDLAKLDQDEFMVKEIMKTLKIPEAAGEEMLETLMGKLQQRNLLLILDNCEHLSRAVAFLTGKLIHAVPGLKILHTSRKVLNIQGEKVWRVPPLSLVNPDNITHPTDALRSEAVQLFNDRARLADQQFELVTKNSANVVQLCNLLDGIPLAIEIVASRIRNFTSSALLQKLRSNFSDFEVKDPLVHERHRTITRTIEWSYNLLLNEQKKLFKRLCVFSGGFDLHAVQAICADQNLDEQYVQDILSSLVDCSMVNTKRYPGKYLRYYMLETVRQFGYSLNSEKDYNQLRRKHLNYFFDQAYEAFQQRMSSQAKWMEKLGLDYENNMAALSWADDHNRSKYRSLASLLGWWWTRSGYINLAAYVLGRLLDEGKLQSATKARALTAYSWAISNCFERYKEYLENVEQAVAIWRRLKNRRELAISMTELALGNTGMNFCKKGLRLAKEAHQLAIELGDPGTLCYVLMALSQCFVNLKRCEEAKEVIHEMLKLADELDHNISRFAANHNWGDCAVIQGHFALARSKYAEGLEWCLKMGDMPYALNELMGIAISESGLGNYSKCLKLVGANNEVAKKVGVPSRETLPMKFWQEFIQEHIIGARNRLGHDLQVKYEAEGAALEFEEAVAYALDFEKSESKVPV